MLFAGQRVASEWIDGPTGQLEILRSRSDTQPESLAVICHPHPQHGGTMHNKVVYTAARAYHDAGMDTLRFNYRGVQGSEGVYDEGRGEIDDACAVVSWAIAQREREHRPPIQTVYWAGFSFGALIALQAAHRCPGTHVTLIAPPVHWLERPFDTLPRGTLNVIVPEADELVPPQRIYEWVDGVTTRQAVSLYRLPDADHFFHGRLAELKALLIQGIPS